MPICKLIHLRCFRLKTINFQFECDGLLIGLSLKLLLLLVATWAIFYRRPKATLPRIHLYRGCVAVLLLVLTATFWVFYLSRLSPHPFPFGAGVAADPRRRRAQVRKNKQIPLKIN